MCTIFLFFPYIIKTHLCCLYPPHQIFLTYFFIVGMLQNCVSQTVATSEKPGGLVKHTWLRVTPQVSDSVGISKFPGDAEDSSGLGTIFENH